MARELEPHERRLLEIMLDQSLPGRDELLAQIPYVRVSGLSCRCGCPSIALQVDSAVPRSGASERWYGAAGYDAEGNIVDIRLDVVDGYMSELDFTEPFATSSTGAAGFPVLETVRPVTADTSAPFLGLVPPARCGNRVGIGFLPAGLTDVVVRHLLLFVAMMVALVFLVWVSRERLVRWYRAATIVSAGALCGALRGKARRPPRCHAQNARATAPPSRLAMGSAFLIDGQPEEASIPLTSS